MTIQGTLVEMPRHPMFEKVGFGMPHLIALRNTLARLLTPFDGRPGSEYVLDYGREVYDDATRYTDLLVLVGRITTRRIATVQAIQRRLNIPANHRGYVNQPERLRLRQQIKVLTRISEQLATAIVTREVQR